jgi:UDP-N-acetylmuramoylalanine--D-glutamate ligase
MKNNSSERMFSGKKITLMGLGLLGRGLNDAKFLAESGAQLKVTDLKSADALLPTLKKLEKYSNIRYTLGQHRLEDFRGVDMVLKAAGVPLNSEFIAEARKHNIPVEMDESLFAKLAGGVKIVGVTGTRGKSTTTMMIFETLLAAKKKFKWKENIYLGGNMKGFATLPLLKKVKEGDIVVLELSSWQLQGFGEARISPHIAVFTNFFDDHLNYYNNDRDLYYNDKSYIYRNQKVGDYFIAPKEILQRAQDASPNLKTNFVIPQTLPHDWHLGVVGEHNVANAELARAACLALGVSEDVIQKSLAAFRGC